MAKTPKYRTPAWNPDAPDPFSTQSGIGTILQQMPQYPNVPQVPGSPIQGGRGGFLGALSNPAIAGSLGQLVAAIIGKGEGAQAFQSTWGQGLEQQRQQQLDQEAREQRRFQNTLQGKADLRAEQESARQDAELENNLKVSRLNQATAERNAVIEKIKNSDPDMPLDLTPQERALLTPSQITHLTKMTKLDAAHKDLAFKEAEKESAFKETDRAFQKWNQEKEKRNELIAHNAVLLSRNEKRVPSLETLHLIGESGWAQAQEMAQDKTLTKEKARAEVKLREAQIRTEGAQAGYYGAQANKANQEARLTGSLIGTATGGGEGSDLIGSEARAVARGDKPITAVPIKMRPQVTMRIEQDGNKVVSPQVRAQIGAFESAKRVLADVAKYSARVNTDSGMTSRITGAGKKAQAVLGTNTDARLLESKVGTLSMLMRAMGEKGTLAEGDIARGIALIPTVFDSKEEAEAKLADISDLLDQAKIDTIRKAGQIFQQPGMPGAPAAPAGSAPLSPAAQKWLQDQGLK